MYEGRALSPAVERTPFSRCGKESIPYEVFIKEAALKKEIVIPGKKPGPEAVPIGDPKPDHFTMTAESGSVWNTKEEQQSTEAKTESVNS